MKVNDMYSKTMADVIESMELIDFKIHNDDEYNVKAIELKFAPVDSIPEKKVPKW